MMVIRYGIVLLLIVLGPALAAAQDGQLSVRVTGQPGGNPLEGVRADLWVQGELQTPSPVSDAAGWITFDLRQAASPGDREVTVTISLVKTHFRRADLTRICAVSGPSGCMDIPFVMEPEVGSSAITNEEKALLEALISSAGVALFIMPYELLPAGSPELLPVSVLAASLDRAITTHIQSLEREDPGGAGMAPLPEISLIPVDSPGLSIAPTNFEKLRAIGAHVQALAVISGSAFMPSASQVEVSSNFLIIPGEIGQVRQRQRVDDRGLSTPLNPFELEARLSPAWAYNTLLAIGIREYALAKKTGQPDQLLRVYRYLVAARSDVSGREGVELHDLDALIKLIETELNL